MIATQSYAAFDSVSPLKPYSFQRRDLGPKDVGIEIKYCGICHTDLHFVKNDLGMTKYPVVPGHEITGVVERVGPKVTRFKVGDHVGVGCMVNSCRTCAYCTRGEEQFCSNFILTYSWVDRDGSITQGGYSTRIVEDEDFVLRMPAALPLDKSAPLLCAGITTYSPLKTWGAGKGTRVAVVGLGGLGHMAVKLASAMGADVTVISTSDRKKDDASRLGAKHFLVSRNKDAMTKAAATFDLMINTVSASHELNDLVALLAVDGTMVLLGVATEPMPVLSVPLVFGRRRIAGSLIGGIAQTQEMLDFCGKHEITSDVEMIAAKQINEAFERLGRSDVRYRFVIDVGTMK